MIRAIAGCPIRVRSLPTRWRDAMSGSWPCGGGVVQFDWCIWSTRYPQLVPLVTEFEACDAFTIAGLYLSNQPNSPVCNLQIRGTILGMIASHLLALNIRARAAGDATAGIVGRVGSASQGSVSTTLELDTPGSAAWWAQTSYGLNAWQALAPYRMGIYWPPPQLPIGQQSYPFGYAVVGGRGRF